MQKIVFTLLTLIALGSSAFAQFGSGGYWGGSSGGYWSNNNGSSVSYRGRTTARQMRVPSSKSSRAASRTCVL